MTKRIKVKKNEEFFADKTAFVAEVDSLATLQVELDSIEAARKKAIHAVEEKYGTRIESIKEDHRARLRICAAYADAHRAELFDGDSKTATTPAAQFGFRDGQPRLALAGRTTWAKVLELLICYLPSFVRTKQEVDKEALLEHYKTAATAQKHELRESLGVELTQDESFWIAPKADEADRANAVTEGGAA